MVLQTVLTKVFISNGLTRPEQDSILHCLWSSLTRTLAQVSRQSRGFHIVASQQRRIRQNLRGVFNGHAFSSGTGY